MRILIKPYELDLETNPPYIPHHQWPKSGGRPSPSLSASEGNIRGQIARPSHI